MNKRLHEIMVEAGYAAPEMAGRAQKLVELITKEYANQFHMIFTDEQYKRRIDKTILNHFESQE